MTIEFRQKSLSAQVDDIEERRAIYAAGPDPDLEPHRGRSQQGGRKRGIDRAVQVHDEEAARRKDELTD